MECEFLGRSRREYTKRNGDPGVAHNLSLMLDSGEVGQLFVSAEVYAQASKLERGDRLIVGIDANVYQGQVQLRPGSLVAA